MGILLLSLLSFVIKNLLVLQLNNATEEGFRHLDDDTKSEKVGLFWVFANWVTDCTSNHE